MCTNKPASLTDEEILTATDAIVARCGRAPEAAIPILQALQTEFRHLPRVALEQVCRTTEITPSQIAGISTFYAQFRHHGTGKHLIQVCHGTACHVAGAELVTDAIRRHLNLKDDQETTEDGLFTVERVGCVGCCSLAPVMLIDGVTFGHLDANKAVDSVEQFLRDEAAGLHDQKREERRHKSQERKAKGQPEVELRVGLNSCCIASGSMQVCEALEKAAAETGADVVVKPVGCTGMCHRVPMVEVVVPGGQSILYGDNNERRAIQIVRQNIQPKGLLRKIGRAVTTAIDLLVNDEAWHDINDHEVSSKHGPGGAFLDRQVRVVTDQCNQLDPLDIEEYIESGGYEALRECVTRMTQDEIIAMVERSGMRGRGGAGFPTAKKWRLTREAPGERRFVVCNGDEGDPGAFMDRMLLEAYPHRVLEGLAIAARAVGAKEGYLYIRAEYAMAVQRVERAIAQAEEQGLLGKRIFGSDFELTLRVMRGAGAFVCGEETALLASIQGLRGMPRFRPPYPAQKGLWECPTNVNNVETYATLPWVVRHGAESFAALGTEKSKGTKVFALAGRIARGGLIEVPMGATISDIVYHIGGGVKGQESGRQFKAVQLGGPSGGCVPARMAHTPIDYEAVRETGAIMGSGGLVVLDDTTCMVDIARFFLDFTQKESCGKCTFCRLGTKRMLEILERLCAGEGKQNDLEELEVLAHQVKNGSLCGLGKTAPNPILTTLRYFRDEYEAHIERPGHPATCPAGKCAALIRYEVQNGCIGCTLCAQQCPVGAIEPTPYEKHRINSALCVRCGGCRNVCPEGAVAIVPRKVAVPAEPQVETVGTH